MISTPLKKGMIVYRQSEVARVVILLQQRSVELPNAWKALTLRQGKRTQWSSEIWTTDFIKNYCRSATRGENNDRRWS